MYHQFDFNITFLLLKSLHYQIIRKYILKTPIQIIRNLFKKKI